MKSLATLALCLLSVGCHRARIFQGLFAIIVPSQDNPYFKAEADAAAAHARELGYRTRIDALAMTTPIGRII